MREEDLSFFLSRVPFTLRSSVQNSTFFSKILTLFSEYGLEPVLRIVFSITNSDIACYTLRPSVEIHVQVVEQGGHSLNVPFKTAVSNTIGDFVENSSEPNVHENQGNRIRRGRGYNRDCAHRCGRVHPWNCKQQQF
jgi:hypothetical protein